jgi:hypothetical protein
MLSEIKAASDTYLHQHGSISSLVPLKLISSEKIRKYPSGNNISSKEKLNSINDNYQKFSNNHLINTHLPIANIQQGKFQSPTVPKQAGTFIHRLVNKFFSISNTNNSHTILNLAPKKRRRQRLKTTQNNHCNVCRKYRNRCQSPIIFNTNATTTQSVLVSEPCLFKKRRTLNASQSQTIASAVELIFDTLMQSY